MDAFFHNIVPTTTYYNVVKKFDFCPTTNTQQYRKNAQKLQNDTNIDSPLQKIVETEVTLI